MLWELTLRILLAPQTKSFALLVLPLHLPSQHEPPELLSVLRMVAAFAFRPKPLAQVTPEHTSSQQAVAVLPVMLLELALRILLAPQTKSFALLVLPLHLPSQHKPPELLSVLRMVAALAFKPKPFAQTTLEQVLSQHLMVGMSLRMLLEFALRIWLAPQLTSLALLVLPLHLPVMSRSQQTPLAAVEVPRILAALALRCE